MSNEHRRVLVRPRFLKGSVIVLILLSPLVAHAGCDYVESRRFARLVQDIRDRHEPVSLYEAQGLREPSGDSALAARYYRAAAALADPEPGATVPVSASDEALVYFERAAALPFERFSAGTNYSYLTSELVGVARLAHQRTRAAAERGEREIATASLFSQLRVQRTFEGTAAMLMIMPGQIEDLEFVLSHAPPDPEGLTSLSRALRELDRDDSLKQAWLRERGFMIDRGVSHASWLQRPVALKSINDRLDQMRVLIDFASRPSPRPLDVPEAAYNGGSNAIREMRIMDEQRIRMAAAYEARVRAGRIAVAAMQYHEKHASWPSQLSVLVPDFLATVPIDPYRGEPMRMIVEADGSFVTYSVGLNNRDDRGMLRPDADRVRIGASRAMAEGDLGIRIAR